MKLSQSEVVIAVLILGIVVLGGIWFWVSIQSPSSINASLPKQFATAFHETLQTELQLNRALLEDLDDMGVPEENQEPFFLLQNVGRAYQRELDWLSQKENAEFEVLSKTENNWQAQKALQSEIGYYILFSYVQTVNQKVTNDVSQTGFDIDQTIQNAQTEILQIQAKSFVPVSELQELATESGLTAEQIRTAITAILADFLEFKKQDFAESVTRYERAVLADQLLSWRFLLESIQVVPNS